ncbi:hypothetical protein M409DRAFT_57090 [Zasmidium cellare ATCC 36951]|uniref:Enoyl reductase (ER) domain-containing protein n=1 Tax=Zasmidium cellare ATCC 36951 TaxID=1080233 RepID=A0A6A6CCT0_ZASCE|nr:uncharacterized protein M409DRAFT_57090 [Zasmidium cellare ATCC 36951]KAF2163988.1 hypothetical protein M409DRAFT_57090 [Zasmidium cellare ATCC 36951]
MTATVKYSRWTLPPTTGHQALALDREATLGSVGDDEVVVELHAASLNYRELVVAKGAAPGDVKANVVPGSDGAGIVKEVGKNVQEFKAGDRVATHLTPTIPNDQFPTLIDIGAGLGQSIDGTLQEVGIFPQSALVHAPKDLSFDRAATLTCSGLTAWNALFGLKGNEVKAGDWVLVQGTGGVSIAALQFASAIGANVVATTSTDEKAKRLESLGAKHVINYRDTPKWSAEARKLTPLNRGFDLIVDVGGDSTLNESLAAVRANGVVAATGILGSDSQPVPMLKTIWYVCTVRGIVLGTRDQFKKMVKFVEEKNLQPVVDDVVFTLEQTKDAYERLAAQKHFSKVIIKIR